MTGENKRVYLGFWPKRLLYFFAFIYPFVLENARMSEGVESYGLVRVIPFPKSIRFVEILFFTVMAIYVLFKTFPSSNKFFSWKELTAIFVSLFIGIVVSLLDDDFKGISFFTRFQVLWLLIAPYLIFFIFYFFKFSKRFFKISINGLFFLGILNAFIGVFQFFSLDLRGDDVNGGMQDAHTFGNLMLLMILWFIILKKYRRFFFLAIFPLIAFVGASSQKSYVVLLLLLFIYILFFSSLLTKITVGAAFFIFGSLFINFVLKNDPQILDRFFSLVEFGLRNSGIGESYTNIVEIHNRCFFSYPFGIGIGNFSNPINYSSFLGDVDVPVSSLFNEKMSNYGVITAFDMQITYIGFLFIEVGFLGVFFIGRFFYRILKKLIGAYRGYRNDTALFTFFALLIPIVSSFFTLLYSMEQITIMYPLMAVAGMLCQDVDPNDKEEIQSIN